MKQFLGLLFVLATLQNSDADPVEVFLGNWTGVNLEISADSMGPIQVVPLGETKLHLSDGTSYTATWSVGGAETNGTFTAEAGLHVAVNKSGMGEQAVGRTSAAWFGYGFSTMAGCWVVGLAIRIAAMFRKPQNPDL